MLAKFYRYVSSSTIGMLSISLYIFADTYYIAQGVGTAGLTALNLLLPAYNFFNALALMVAVGGATLFSLSKKQEVFKLAIYLTWASALPFTIGGCFFSEQIALYLGADHSTLHYTAQYLHIMLTAAPLFMLNTVIADFVRNDKQPKLVMAAMLTSSLSNILLDYLFVMVFKWSMFGAALATAICPCLSLLVLSSHWFYFKRRYGQAFLAFRHVSLAKVSCELPHYCRRIIALGIPSFVMEISSGIVIAVYNNLLLGKDGNLAVAAYAIVANLAMIALSIFYGIAKGVQPLLSDAVYHNKPADIRLIWRQTCIVLSILTISLYLFFLKERTFLVDAFNENGNVHLQILAENACTLYFLGMIPAAFNILFATYYAARGFAKTAQFFSLLRSIVLLLPLIYAFAYLAADQYIWLAFPVTELLVLLLAAYNYIKNKAVKHITAADYSG